MLSTEDSLNLKKMVSQAECEDNTEYIRRVKHSDKIRKDIAVLEKLKKDKVVLFKSNFSKFRDLASKNCSFLASNYSDIFNKIVADELNLDIMNRFLVVLKWIEEERVDQHQASVTIGKLLKELYIDSALKRTEHLEEEHSTGQQKSTPRENKQMSWKQWKESKEGKESKEVEETEEKPNK